VDHLPAVENSLLICLPTPLCPKRSATAHGLIYGPAAKRNLIKQSTISALWTRHPSSKFISFIDVKVGLLFIYLLC